eukprot:m.36227 g.36227  ORF g.36227 m.36227 type:complete len:114 (+) comp12461_c0_seq6:1046-1387(+)
MSELYEQAFDAVTQHLQSITIPKSKRKAINDRSVRSVTLGQVNQPFSKFKGYSKFTEQHPELWKAVVELGEQLDPEHSFSSVNEHYNLPFTGERYSLMFYHSRGVPWQPVSPL